MTTTFILYENTVALIITLIIPVVVAMVTKSDLDARWKASISIVLSAAVVFITNAVDETGKAVFSGQMLFEVAMATAIQLASYLGFWKPVLEVNETMLPDKGIGSGSLRHRLSFWLWR